MLPRNHSISATREISHVVKSAYISTPHFANLFDYDENFSEQCIRCPLPGTVVGPSHLGHEVLDCQVNVHFEEDRPCGNSCQDF